MSSSSLLAELNEKLRCNGFVAGNAYISDLWMSISVDSDFVIFNPWVEVAVSDRISSVVDESWLFQRFKFAEVNIPLPPRRSVAVARERPPARLKIS